MTQDAQSELPGLYTAVEVVERHIEQLPDAGGSAAAEGTKSREPVEPVEEHEVVEGRRGSLVAVKDDLYARITDLGGQWPRTEVGGKQPPIS